ncbi:MAG: N-6 DNA methylase, partial [bacterium]
MNPLEDYLRQLRDIHGSGARVPETSYYPALSNLLNSIGATLKPKVRCIINPANQGAGIPDGGLYTPDQFPKSGHTDPLPGTKPSRGAIEAKPVKDDAWFTAEGKQVTKYWGAYRQVLVTNYRDFLLVGSDTEGNPELLDHYRLAANEKAFWAAASKPQILAKEHAERFTEFLKRAMLHAAPLITAKDLAWYLASYAREARARVESHKLDALDALRHALEETLGVKFEGDDGDHFFRSTLVQTLFYGVFSAWVVWSRDHSHADRKVRFDWRVTQFFLRVPVLRVLFNQLAEPGKLDELRLSEVLDWAGAALNRVDRAAFFDGFQEQLAVQYFYEPFLEAYDPDLRKQLGVWYTPREIVQYMVARVDAVLREELNLADGLADRNVYVLDPCCGTGAYLVEVLKKIAETLKLKGGGALTAQEVKRAALERVFGFELLPAPFVIAHLQLGLTLREIGAPLSDKKKERAGIFLTNALTG